MSPAFFVTFVPSSFLVTLPITLPQRQAYASIYQWQYYGSSFD
ncbi:hypothetical protein [Coleofasciculus sp. FACHB-T130]|nr:hypothetical protein [Coleofasciculus sp. FACHB-T130]